MNREEERNRGMDDWIMRMYCMVVTFARLPACLEQGALCVVFCRSEPFCDLMSRLKWLDCIE